MTTMSPTVISKDPILTDLYRGTTSYIPQYTYRHAVSVVHQSAFWYTKTRSCYGFEAAAGHAIGVVWLSGIA